MSLFFFLFLFLFLFLLISSTVASELVLESGYSVSTVLDFNGAPSTVNPWSVLPRHRSKELLLLDSTNSAFYSIPTPISQEREVSLVSGKGVTGFSDGDGTAAMFGKPRSFAVDGRDNVYVADRLNHAIRKISTSGFTSTIAGGYSSKTGHIDGPAQNASFSNDFDLVYVPTMCALLISDRGNRLIRQIDLKLEDCAQKSQSGLGATYVSAIAAICLLLGAVFGFVTRPFFGPREVSSSRFINQTWKHYRTNLGRMMLMACSAVRSAIVNSTLPDIVIRLVNLSLCYLAIVFRNIRLEKRVEHGRKTSINKIKCDFVSLLDSDKESNHVLPKPESYADQLKDLISFDEGLGALVADKPSSEQMHVVEDGPRGSSSNIDDMMRANLLDFGEQPKQNDQILGSTAQASGLVQRKQRKVDDM